MFLFLVVKKAFRHQKQCPGALNKQQMTINRSTLEKLINESIRSTENRSLPLETRISESELAPDTLQPGYVFNIYSKVCVSKMFLTSIVRFVSVKLNLLGKWDLIAVNFRRLALRKALAVTYRELVSILKLKPLSHNTHSFSQFCLVVKV